MFTVTASLYGNSICSYDSAASTTQFTVQLTGDYLVKASNVTDKTGALCFDHTASGVTRMCLYLNDPVFNCAALYNSS